MFTFKLMNGNWHRIADKTGKCSKFVCAIFHNSFMHLLAYRVNIYLHLTSLKRKQFSVQWIILLSSKFIKHSVGIYQRKTTAFCW